MARYKNRNSADFIVPLDMDGLHGRMLRLPTRNRRKKREILLVYGHHASLERMFGLAEDLSKYGNVTLPDLPGFGGMESFYKINQKPTIDNLADYLAAFIKLRYRRKRITIMGMSFGFVVVTKMLQRYPELAEKVDLLVSFVGFAHKDDFKFKPYSMFLLKNMARVFSRQLPALAMRHLILRRLFIRAAYGMVAKSHSKLHDADAEERKKRIDFEVHLWQCNDIRTYMHTTLSMLHVDLCKKQIPLNLYHIAVAEDRYFDNDIVEQHLSVIFENVEMLRSKLEAHAPTVVADAKAAAPFVPRKMRRILADPA
jgi:pimeloyl-ACP methyl ester carboxylesterase